MTLAVGHFPEGDEDGMRRVGGCWSDTADGCRAMAEQHDAAAATISSSVAGETATEMVRKHRELADIWRTRAETADGLAAQAFEGANAVEFEKLVVIVTAAILAAQLVVDGLMIGAGGALKALADRAIAETTMRAAWQVLLQRLAAAVMRSATAHPVVHLAGRAALFGAAQGGGVSLAAQAIQAHDGHRESIDYTSAAIATAAGAAGAAAGVVTARLLSPSALRLVGTSATTRAEGFARVFGCAALLGSAGGLVGGIVGAGAAALLSGSTLDADSLAEAVVPGVAGGLFGAAGVGARAARSATAPAHIRHVPADIIGSRQADFTVGASRPDLSDPLAAHGIVTVPFDPHNPPAGVAHLPHLPESPVRVDHTVPPTTPTPSRHEVPQPVPVSAANTGSAWLGLGQHAPELTAGSGGGEPTHLSPIASRGADPPGDTGPQEGAGGPGGPASGIPGTPEHTVPSRSEPTDVGPRVPPTNVDPPHSPPPELPENPSIPADPADPPDQTGQTGEGPGTPPLSEVSTLPDPVQAVLDRIGDTPGDPAAITRAQEHVAARYRENLEVQAHRQYWNQFKNTLAAEIRAGRNDPDAEQRARQHAAEVAATPETRAVVATEASDLTKRWANRIGPERFIEDALLQDTDAAAPPDSAHTSATRPSHPPAIARILDDVAETGHPDRTKSAARRLILTTHELNLTAESNTFAQKQTRRHLVEFENAGIPGDRAERLAVARTDEFLRTSMAQRTVHMNAEIRTREWVGSMRARAEVWGEDFTRWLHRIDNVATVRGYLRTVEERADAVVTARPDLLNRGGFEWMDKLRDHAAALDAMSTYLEAEKAPRRQTHPDTLEQALQNRHHPRIRGLHGELRLAEMFLSRVDSVNQVVSCTAPTGGGRWKTDIDAITDGNRYWREVKNVPASAQLQHLPKWIEQARKQLIISYRNRDEYWVDGAPPKVSWLSLNGFIDEVRRALTGIRITDADGNPVADHTIEVLRAS
ncbi:WXG100-like domain-containing protein [Nocardia brasiliensis]